MINQLYFYIENIFLFFKRFSNLIFFCFAGILLGVAIYLLGVIATSSPEDTSKPAPVSASPVFDQNTIDQIKKLRSSSDLEGSTFTLPSPRSNPLVE